jgi:hypothetical protein
MPRFTNPPPLPPQISDGVHVCKVLKARAGVSSNGNETLIMRLGTPSGERITSVLTFVERASRVISCFCDSAELTRPDGKEQQFELTPKDVTDRYLYVVVSSEPDPDTGDPVPRVVRFLTRTEALRRNPELEKIRLQPQSPRSLRTVK